MSFSWASGDSDGSVDGEYSYEMCDKAKPKRRRPSGAYVPLVQKIQDHIESKKIFFSLEFFPPRTPEGGVNLISRLERMAQGGPLFCDITWHASGNPGSDCETSSITIAGVALNYCGLDTMLHLTCVGMKKAELNAYLDRAKELGIRNILALRGDLPNTPTEHNGTSDFRYAIDMVKHIRETYGNYFTICVAGYPTKHPEARTYEDDIRFLKAKVDAGADFIITQLFFESQTFIQFVRDCQAVGIKVPILPGIMLIQSYDSLRNIMKLSGMDVPQNILDGIKPVATNDEAVRNYGIHYATAMCRDLLNSGLAPGLHFYTLNREIATIAVLKNLGLWRKSPQKMLPWPTVPNHKRCTEDVRPIFWATRPKSYVYRTAKWDEFPNGRWGNSASPAFGELKDYYMFIGKSRTSSEELRRMWGLELVSEQDIYNIFRWFLSGETNKHGVKVKRIPWSDGELSPETAFIGEKLKEFNSKGFLTINSQPNVNGVDSTDAVYGWGAPGGYVYQKAYIEFFTSRENALALKALIDEGKEKINYHMINVNGSENYTNNAENTPIAVTWGVFPGKEIIQPTVVDPVSFEVWKDEAFSLWTDSWANLYPENSHSRKLLEHVKNTYFLVNLVDNDYPKECCLWQLLEDVQNTTHKDNKTNGHINGNCRQD